MGLAPVVVDEILGFVRTLADEGASLLIVEQYVVRALELADYVFVLSRGRIVFSGEPAELDTDAVFRSYMGRQDATPVSA
jgi:branched-chain amino acid transport system ATP-binding protein